MKSRALLSCLALALLAGGFARAAVLDVPATYATIQAGIDAAAPGDTVAIAAGVFEEDLDLHKSLTLTGAGQHATVLRCPPTIRNYLPYKKKPIILVHDTPSVTFEDFALDGYLRATPDSSLIGLAFWNAGGSVRRCVLRDLREPVPGASQSGVGVFANNNLATPDLTLSFTDVTVENYQKSGFALYGRGLRATLTNCVVDGSRLASHAVQNGIEVGFDASAVITGALVTGNLSYGPTLTACGFLPYYAGSVDIRDSRIVENGTSLYYIGSNGRLDRCWVEGVVAQPAGSGLVVVNSTGLPKQTPIRAGVVTLGAAVPFSPEDAVPPGAKAARTVIVNDCDVIGHKLSDTAGLVALAQIGETHLTAMNSRFSDWDCGIDVADGLSPVLADLRHNQIDGNMLCGAAAATATPVDARYGWWGDGTGPWHPTLNPGGQANQVGDHVLFVPWTGNASIGVEPPAAGPIRCGQTVAITYRYVPHAPEPSLRGFDVTLRVGPELSVTGADFVDLDPFAGLGPHFFRALPLDASTWVVSCALLGGSAGVTAPADLFRVVAHGAASGSGVVAMTALELRALDNGEIAATLPDDATVLVDCEAPAAVSDISAAPHHDRIAVSWTNPPADVDSLEVWRGLWHDGAHASAYPEYDDLPADVIPARPASRAAAAASPDWALAGRVPAGASDFSDLGMGAARGVYYYEVFAKDAAGNWSPPAAANDRATSYWLGDVPPYVDGWCGIGDITKLGSSYGTSVPDPLFDPAVDVGPSDDRSRLGVPTTDDRIDFEDLMIFAMNFSVVTPTNKAGDDDAPVAAPPGGRDPVRLAWRQVDSRTWALDLVAACPSLQGVRVTVDLPGRADVAVAPGERLLAPAIPHFLRNMARDDLDVSLALLGADATVRGPGELLRWTLSAGAQENAAGADAADVAAVMAAALAGARVFARAHDNADLPVCLDGVATGPGALPSATRLVAVTPNPFNPSTTIRYALAAPSRARLRLFALDGRLVRTLVDGDLPAGDHAAFWNGLDARGRAVASGTYFCRLEAAGRAEVRKLVLAK